MIYEMRTYTLRPGAQALVARTAGDVARRIRGDEHGRLEGYWSTEIGPLNQVVHLWSYESFDERARLRAVLASNDDWTGEYLPLIRPHLLRQEVRLMRAISPVGAPGTSGNFYELRTYRAVPTRVAEVAGLFAEILAVREEYSPCSGGFVCEAPQPNEICQLWSYPDLSTRTDVRTRLMEDPRWVQFLGKVAPLIEDMHATMMLPAAHSPMQ